MSWRSQIKKSEDVERKLEQLRRIRSYVGEVSGILESSGYSRGFSKESADDIQEVAKHLRMAFEILEDFGGITMEIDSTSPLQG